MTDISELGVKIDSSGAKKGSRESVSAIKQIGDAASKHIDQTATKAFNKFGAAITGVAAAAAVFATGRFVVSSIRQFADFSHSISELSAITGATGRDLKFLSDAAEEFGRTTTLSASKAAEAFKLIASAKPDLLSNLQALKDTTAATITLAEASGLDLATAAQSLGQALNQFGAGAESANRFINVLAAGSKFGTSAISDTAEALINAGLAANSAGLSFEEANAAIQLFAKTGEIGSRSGVALRSILTKLSTKLNSEDTPAVVGFTESLRRLGPIQDDITALTKIFGEEYVNLAQALIKNTRFLDEFTQKLTDTNTAFEQAKTRTDDLTGDLLQLESAWQGLKITIGRAFNDISRASVQALTSFINGITDLLKNTELLLTRMGFLWDSFWRGVEVNIIRFRIAIAEVLPGEASRVLEETLRERLREITEESKTAVAKFALDMARISGKSTVSGGPPVIEITGGAPPGAPPGGGPTGPGEFEGPNVALFVKKAKEQQEAFNAARKEAIAIANRNKTAEEEFNEALGKTLELYNQGLLSEETFDREAMRLNEQFKKDMQGTKKEITDNVQEIVNAIHGFGDELTEFFVSVTRTGKFEFKSLIDAIIADITRMVVRLLIVQPLVKSITGALTGGGGGGGFSKFLGFQTGGQFMVPGSGPKLTPIVAHGGERVTVETPSQQRSSSGSVSVSVTINLQSLDPSNATQVVRQSLPALQNEITGIVNQAFNARGRRGPLG